MCCGIAVTAGSALNAYNALKERFAEIDALGGALSMLNWDQAVMMPPGGAAARAEQIATLAVLRHGRLTDPGLGDALAMAEAVTPDHGWDRANLREMRRQWRLATAMPAQLVAARSKAASACEMAWRMARADADFPSLIPSLTQVLARTREAAMVLGQVLGVAPYDALIDEFEPGASRAMIDPLFDDLASFLPAFLGQVMTRQKAMPPPAPLEGIFPIAAQRALGLRFMEALGFDFHHGRLDVSLHPFTGGVPEDVRITTRYREDSFTQAMMGVLHETGHALYELGLPADWRGQPVGEARGMALHESQSLMVEMQICRSREFLEFAAPLMRRAFQGEASSDQGSAWSPENLFRLYTRVQPGSIRVDADEVTYPLHIILRYRLEQALLSGDLAVADLPLAWNDTMQSLLGVTPPDASAGCLQDIHWPAGNFGYFPTYSLGALTAAQLALAMRRDVVDVPGLVARGEFAPLVEWLRQRIHGLGSSLSTQELIGKATGAPLGTTAFKAHLTARYLA
jgi:carboxypeptidase Taq